VLQCAWDVDVFCQPVNSGLTANKVSANVKLFYEVVVIEKRQFQSTTKQNSHLSLNASRPAIS
jgi:hypothetical protein